MPRRVDDRPWTRQEKQQYKNPVAAIAAAVVAQWEADGCPSSSKEAIGVWKGIYNEAVRLKKSSQ